MCNNKNRLMGVMTSNCMALCLIAYFYTTHRPNAIWSLQLMKQLNEVYKENLFGTWWLMLNCSITWRSIVNSLFSKLISWHLLNVFLQQQMSPCLQIAGTPYFSIVLVWLWKTKSLDFIILILWLLPAGQNVGFRPR